MTADPVERTAHRVAGTLGGTLSGFRRLSGGASRVTFAFDVEGPGATRPCIIQSVRSGALTPPERVGMEVALLRAAHEVGVPVPGVVAAEPESGWMVVDRVPGETIPRKILRDPGWEGARGALAAQCGRALAAIHTIEPDSIPGLGPSDPFADPLAYLDMLKEVRPALELGVRWLEAHRPGGSRRVSVHGDFRIGNLLVGPEGLRAVLDWELAHAGDPAEDLGWLCAPPWRFGGAGEVGGFGPLPELLEAYVGAGGEPVSAERVHWWEVYATVKWATICALQASAHLSGATRSVELAAIGRRLCECEWDLFGLLGLEPSGPPGPEADPRAGRRVTAPFGRPTAAELVEAVREYVEGTVMARSEGAAQFEARVAANALATVERELVLGPAIAGAHRERLRTLGFADDAALAGAIRSGRLDDDWRTVGSALASAARDQLLVANPAYLGPTGHRGAPDPETRDGHAT